MQTFADLGIAAPVLRAIAASNYTTPTPIQAQAIPPIMAGRDLLGIAQTGTGKTAAFALPILHRLRNAGGRVQPKTCRVLILSPTRELASQIAASFKAYGQFMRCSVFSVFGGVSIRPQIARLAGGVDVLVATPGRLIDHMTQGTLNLSGVEVLVLDEADQMMDLGFIHALRRIVAALPAQRQSLFFSATMPKEIDALAADLLSDPVRVSATPVATTAERVDQRVILIDAARKKQALADLVRSEQMARALVFTRTKRGADNVSKYLGEVGLSAMAIHGNKSQAQRERALSAFKEGKVAVLVATDVAARGIDIDAVSHVVNFELPNVPESYVHRIGRTARAGAGGQAISLVENGEQAQLRSIQKLIKKTIPSVDQRSAGQQEMAPPPPKAHAGRHVANNKGARNGPRRQQRAGGPGAVPTTMRADEAARDGMRPKTFRKKNGSRPRRRSNTGNGSGQQQTAAASI